MQNELEVVAKELFAARRTDADYASFTLDCRS
jgi:hypothetical protein